jgi:glycosyltransferase involved in cell wall biosynthesis
MFSILIPSWNNLEHLRLCVRSIRQNSAHAHQIVVHVNDGSDGSREWVMAEGLDATFSETNVGICWAMNEAAQLADHDLIVYLNDDMYCLPGWDAALLARAAAMPCDRFLLSGTMVEPRATGNACVVVADHGDSIASFREESLLAAAPSLVRADWSGATWPPTVVHRKWWFNCGGYSTELSPGMGSDNDFSMKLWQAGCRHFVGVGDALVYHFQQKSTAKVAKNDGRRQFLDKWGMSQSTFDRHYLRRGQPLDAPQLTEPAPSAALRYALWRGRMKKRFG